MKLLGPGLQGGATAAAPVGGPPPSNTTPPAHRVDPFKPTWPPPPPPNVLAELAPVRIASLGTAVEINKPDIEIREIPTMRVAGIMSGNGVYALLDGGPEPGMVVKPGDQVGEYHVSAINPDSVVLKKSVKVGLGTQTYTQVVPLTDAGSAPAARMSGPGVGTLPGGGRNRPMPGVGGGRRGGGASAGGGAGEN